MKKLLLLAAILCTGVSASMGQDAKAIVDRYNKETNLVTMLALKDYNSLIEMDMNVDAGGMKLEIATKIISQSTGNKMRMEMSMMGQDMLYIMNGEQGWAKVEGTVQEIPAEQVSQTRAQGEVLEKIAWTEANYTMEYIGEEGDYDIVKFTTLKEEPTSQTVKFSKATGLVEFMIEQVGDNTITTALSEYKQFGKYKLPSILKTTVDGKDVATITIKKIMIGYPVSAYMFAKPE